MVLRRAFIVRRSVQCYGRRTKLGKALQLKYIHIIESTASMRIRAHAPNRTRAQPNIRAYGTFGVLLCCCLRCPRSDKGQAQHAAVYAAHRIAMILCHVCGCARECMCARLGVRLRLACMQNRTHLVQIKAVQFIADKCRCAAE